MTRICEFQGCGRINSAKRLCSGHYRQLRESGELRPLREKNNLRQCSKEGCFNKHRSKGFCLIHYRVFCRALDKSERKRCIHKSCQSLSQKESYCEKHYEIIVLGKSINKGGRPKKQKQVCEIENCDNFSKCKGLCSKHYERVKRHRDPHVNYTRKYHSTKLVVDNVLRPHMSYTTTLDEREAIKEVTHDYYENNNE